MTDHRSAAVTGNREPDHIFAESKESKESKVFQFIITITAPEQRRGVLYFIKAISLVLGSASPHCAGTLLTLNSGAIRPVFAHASISFAE